VRVCTDPLQREVRCVRDSSKFYVKDYGERVGEGRLDATLHVYLYSLRLKQDDGFF
jgi:hypothetical protein